MEGSWVEVVLHWPGCSLYSAQFNLSRKFVRNSNVCCTFYLTVSIGHEVCLTNIIAHGSVLAGDNMCRRWLAICFNWSTKSTG